MPLYRLLDQWWTWYGELACRVHQVQRKRGMNSYGATTTGRRAMHGLRDRKRQLRRALIAAR
jgi:hypothetical protein